MDSEWLQNLKREWPGAWSGYSDLQAAMEVGGVTVDVESAWLNGTGVKLTLSEGDDTLFVMEGYTMSIPLAQAIYAIWMRAHYDTVMSRASAIKTACDAMDKAGR